MKKVNKKQFFPITNNNNYFFEQVIKKKKEEWNSGVKSISTVPDLNEKVETPVSKSSEKAATAHSFGQAAGLKDDLDVDDNDVGK